jgi:hypothetical protein
MPDIVRKVEYFSVFVPNKPAQAFSVLSTLVSADINLLGCTGVQRGRRAQIDVVPDDPERFRRVVKKAGLDFKPEKSGFLIQGRDRPGALAEHLRVLGERAINVTGIDSLSAGDGRWGAIIWVENDAVRRAARVLGARASGPPFSRRAAQKSKPTAPRARRRLPRR